MYVCIYIYTHIKAVTPRLRRSICNSQITQEFFLLRDINTSGNAHGGRGGPPHVRVPGYLSQCIFAYGRVGVRKPRRLIHTRYGGT